MKVDAGIRMPAAGTPPLLGADAALFLDFDGTLAEIAPTPDAVQPPAAMAALVAELHELLHGALALITGRRLESLDRYFAPLKPAGAGLHGAQLRLLTGETADDPHVPAVAAVCAVLRHQFADDSRVLVEDKGAAVALHYRLAPERREECEALLCTLAESHDLGVIAGHAVIEARPRGIDKGVGLRALMQGAAFAGRRPLFIGDDRTDEDAIVAAQALGGDGVRVGGAESAARYRLRDVEHVHVWLEASRDALRSGALA